MSLSRISAKAQEFTPVSLVRESIDIPFSEPENEQHKTETEPQNTGSEQRAEQQNPAQQEGQERIKGAADTAPSQATDPETEQERESQEEPPPPPEPVVEIDTEAIRQEGYEQGLKEGIKEASATYEKEYRQSFAAFEQATIQINELYTQLIAQYREELIRTTIALCQNYLGHDHTIRQDLITNTLQRAVSEAISSEEFHISLHPDDLHQVSRLVPELVASVRDLQHIELLTDKKLTPGGCVIDSKRCTVDATLETMIQETKQLLQNSEAFLSPEGPGQEQSEPEPEVKIEAKPESEPKLEQEVESNAEPETTVEPKIEAKPEPEARRRELSKRTPSEPDTNRQRVRPRTTSRTTPRT